MLIVKVGVAKALPSTRWCQDMSALVGRGAGHSRAWCQPETTVVDCLGKPPRFVTSISGVESRYTDRETLEIFCMAYAGKMNNCSLSACSNSGSMRRLSGVDA